MYLLKKIFLSYFDLSEIVNFRYKIIVYKYKFFGRVFRELLNLVIQYNYSQTEYRSGGPTDDEIRTATNALKNNKPPGKNL